MAIKFLSDVETTSSSTLSIGQLDNPNSTPTEFLVATGSGLVGFRTAAEILSDIGSENSYLQTLAFDTSTGIITASVLNESDVTVDIDGRYLELGGGTITGNLVLNGTFADSNGSVGTSGQVLSSTVTGTDWVDAGGGGTPAGSNTQIQFNDSGAFGADSNLTWNGTDLDIIGNIIGGNTSILYMRQIKLDEATAASAGSNGRGARVFKFGTQALAAGTVYALTSGGWANAKATQVDLLSTGLLGVATTSTSGDPLLMDGVIYLNNDPGGSIGSVIYLNTTAGSLTNDVSGFTTGNVVRVVGHKVGTNKVYFNPSRDWIEIS
jgi:hypothetical protein